MPANNSVTINFRVNGGDLQSYMDQLNQRALNLSRQMLRQAEQESDVAKDQLRSYQAQIAALQRKLETEAQLAELEAGMSRETRIDQHNDNIQARYADLDDRYERGEITRRQHRQGVRQVDEEDKAGVQGADERYQQEIRSISEQRRDNALLIRTMRDNVDTVRSTSQQEIRQMRNGDESLVDAIQDDDDPTALLANRLASQQFVEEQARENDKKGKDQESMFGSLMKAFAFEKVGAMFSQIPNAKNELDFVKPMLSIGGMGAGALVGSGFEALTAGQIEYASIGANMGEKVGEFFGEAFARSFKSREELMGSNYQLQALTGQGMQIDAFGKDGLGGTGLAKVTADLSAYGSDFKETAQLQFKLAQAQANGRNLNGGAENMLAAQQGLGIGQDIFIQLVELLRSSRDQNRDVIKLIGGVASAGKNNVFANDRTFLAEFMQKNFTNTQKMLLQTQNEVASGTTFDILKRFNALGGPWEARDPRSGGLINTVQNSLANPGSDNVKALSFLALREQDPSMNFYQILEEQQKGLASPKYLKSMLAKVDSMGGNEEMKMYNVANLLGLGGNLAAARKLYQNKDQLMSGQISTEELLGSGEYSESGLRGLGKEQTGKYTSSTAEIENEFIKSAVSGITLVGDKMKDLFGDMMGEIKKYVDAKVDSLYKGDAAAPPMKQNQAIHKVGGDANKKGGGGW